MEFNAAIDKIKELETNGINCDVTTEDIINRLTAWSQQFDFEITDVDHATVKLSLKELPDNLASFCKEVYTFCPDTVDQGYGCIFDLIEHAEMLGPPQPELIELVEGLDPEDELYGLKVMERDLARKGELVLWWD